MDRQRGGAGALEMVVDKVTIIFNVCNLSAREKHHCERYEKHYYCEQSE